MPATVWGPPRGLEGERPREPSAVQHRSNAGAWPWDREKNTLRVLLVGLLALALSVGLAGADPVSLTVLQTTDLHAFLEHSDRLPEGGGWLRLATLIQGERGRRGADQVLLIDCGDACVGTLEGLVSRGQVGVDLLGALAVDVWVPGNHELDLGVARFHELCQPMAPRILCGNLTYDGGGASQRFTPWRLFSRSGVRIAVIGATARYLDQWLWGDIMVGYRVEPAVAAIMRIMPEVLAAEPHLVVLAIHQGWLERDPRHVNEIPEIVERFPQIDLILGGHTHRERPGMKLGPKTWYVQAGSDAAFLAVVEVKVDPQQRQVLDISSKLLAAGPEVPIDPEAHRVAAPWLEAASRRGREPVATLQTEVTAKVEHDRGQPCRGRVPRYPVGGRTAAGPGDRDGPVPADPVREHHRHGAADR